MTPLSFGTHVFPRQLPALIRPTTYYLFSIPHRPPDMPRSPFITSKLRILLTAFPEIHHLSRASLVWCLLVTLILTIVVSVLRGWGGGRVLLRLFWMWQLFGDVFDAYLLWIIIVLAIILVFSFSIIVTFSTIPIELFYNDIQYVARAYGIFLATKIWTQLLRDSLIELNSKALLEFDVDYLPWNLWVNCYPHVLCLTLYTLF